MTKLLKNRVVLAAVSIVLALVLATMFYLSVGSTADKQEVVTITEEVPAGTQIEDSMVKITEVGGYGLAENAATDKSQVVGKYALADFAPGDLILESKVSDSILDSSDMLRSLDGSHTAISVGINDFADGLSDKLMTGDIVSCIITDDQSTFIPPELTYVQVLAVTDASGVDQQSEQKTEDSENMATVTLLATPEQAQLLAGYDENAVIHFSLVYRGDEQTAQQFLDAQSGVLAQ